MFLEPQDILRQISFQKNEIAADLGCGSGGWVAPLAKILEDGTIFAVDIQESALSALQSRLKREKVFNVKTILDNAESKIEKIPPLACDWVLLTNLLFQLEDKKAVFQETNRILKENGKILLVDWKPEASFGPQENRISKEEVLNLAEESGFIKEKELDAGLYHFAFVFKKG